jgi:hypothetical protein
MNNYNACTTIAVTPAPPGLYNVFARCPDCEVVATLTQSELDDGEADRLVTERAEMATLEDLEDSEPGS